LRAVEDAPYVARCLAVKFSEAGPIANQHQVKMSVDTTNSAAKLGVAQQF
jgi:hypothetical protein